MQTRRVRIALATAGAMFLLWLAAHPDSPLHAGLFDAQARNQGSQVRDRSFPNGL